MTKGLTCLTRFAVLTVTAVVSLCAQRPDISWMRGGHWSGPYLLAYSPDGTTLISIGEDIKVWSVSDGMLLRTIRSPFVEFFNPGSSALSADSTLVAAAGVVSKTVALVRTDDPGADPQWNIPLASPYLSFSPDGSQIVASGIFGNPAIYFLSPIDGSVARTIPYIQFPGGVHEPSSAAVFSPGAGSTLALCSSDYASCSRCRRLGTERLTLISARSRARMEAWCGRSTASTLLPGVHSGLPRADARRTTQTARRPLR